MAKKKNCSKCGGLNKYCEDLEKNIRILQSEKNSINQNYSDTINELIELKELFERKRTETNIKVNTLEAVIDRLVFGKPRGEKIGYDRN